MPVEARDQVSRGDVPQFDAAIPAPGGQGLAACQEQRAGHALLMGAPAPFLVEKVEVPEIKARGRGADDPFAVRAEGHVLHVVPGGLMAGPQPARAQVPEVDLPTGIHFAAGGDQAAAVAGKGQSVEDIAVMAFESNPFLAGGNLPDLHP